MQFRQRLRLPCHVCQNSVLELQNAILHGRERNMRAVRSTGDLATRVVLEDVPEAPGVGELIDVRSASICSSDLMYIGYGLTRILGHEVAGVLADGTAVAVEAMYGCGECAQW